ncbi:acyl--CoA ligase [Streptomyces antibioticus]|nr:class I adenylate-forming enzyme family protein [Streptomyces antibioticus]KOG70080.1 acyl--CoA ligase [Streptomyces antibioticus]
MPGPLTSAAMDTTRDDHARAHTYRGTPFGPPWPLHDDIISRLTRHAASRAGAPCLTTVAADGTETTLSYREVDTAGRRMADWLRRTAGPPRGTVVGLMPRNDAASVVAILGLLRAGHPMLMLSPDDPPGRTRQLLDAMDVTLLLRSPTVPAAPGLASLALPGVPELTGIPSEVTESAPDPASDAFFFGTSGSTAAAKLVAQSRYNATVNAAAVTAHHRLKPGDRILGCLPLHHVNGLHFTVLGTVAAGAHLVLAHEFDPFRYPGLLARFRPRLASVVPSVLEGLVHTSRGLALPGEFEYFVSAAAPLTTRTARDVRQRLGVPVVQGYGLTETTNFSATMPPDLSAESFRRLLYDAEIPSIGTAVHGNEMAVLRSDGSRADPGETGEIGMRGHNVMSRYAGNEEATAAAFLGGWFHSQDLGYAVRDEDDGREFFFITGRSKNIAKIGGESVSLEEMERLLRAAPGVRDAACARLPHRLTGEQIAAAVVFEGEERPDLRAHLATSFAAAVLPRRFVELDAVPRTATGKILRPQLAELLS